MGSFTASGLEIDRLADIKLQMQTDLKDAFGAGISLDEREPFGILIGIMAERYALLNELLEAVNNASYPSSAFGVYLDQLAAFNGVVREQATASVVDVQFTREAGTSGDITIPQGTQVYQQGSTILWSTDEEVIISDGSDTISVQATASETGAIVGQAGTITQFVAKVGQVESVTNPNDATLGQAEETDSELKLRRNDQVAVAGTATASGIKSALNLLDVVRSAQVVLNDTDVEVNGQKPHSVASFVSAETGVTFKQDSEVVFSLPIVTGQAVAININGTPVAGSPFSFDTSNENTLDNIATALQNSALISTAVRSGSNKIIVTGGSGLEVVISATVTGPSPQAQVSQIFTGDDVESVAQALWDSKAGGIQTDGDIAGIATDDENNTHILYFSQVESVDIDVQYTLSVDSTYEQSTTEAAVKQAAVEYGSNFLTPSVDVLAYKLLCVASDVGASGIRTLTCAVRVTGGGSPSYTDIVEIDSSEIGVIDSANITFVYV